MNIMIVFPSHPAELPAMVEHGEDRIFFRSQLSGMRCVAVERLIFMPRCSEQQKVVASEKTRVFPTARIIDLGTKMSVITAAEESRNIAVACIQDAIQNLSRICVEQCWGSDEFSEEYSRRISNSFATLQDIRRNLDTT